MWRSDQSLLLLENMREDQHKFLTLRQWPARLNVEQVACVLNCQVHDVPILVATKLLKPLGSPQPNSVKYFAAFEVQELLKDRSWLSRMTNALNQHWRNQNAKRKNSSLPSPEGELALAND